MIPEWVRGALEALSEVWPDEPIYILGALALALQGRLGGRETEDLDVTIAVDLEKMRETMSAAPRWRAVERPHRWVHDSGAIVDILPSAIDLIASGRIRWPDSGVEMSLQGFGMLHAESIPLDPDWNPDILVASVPTVAVLKVFAYLDRPHEREKDLRDLAYLFDNYVGVDEDRLYTGEAAEEGLFDVEASTWLLGYDIGRCIPDREYEVFVAFLAGVLSEQDVLRTSEKLASRGPVSWGADVEVALERVRLLLRGLEAGRVD